MHSFYKVSLVSVVIVAIFLLGLAFGALKADMLHQDKTLASISWNARPENYEEQKKQRLESENHAYWASAESPLTMLSTTSVSVVKNRVNNPMFFEEMKKRLLECSPSSTVLTSEDESRLRTNSALLQPYSAIQYTLTYSTLVSGDSDPLTFFITLVPNVPGYQTLEDIQKDFAMCAVGGSAYPARVSPKKKWVVLRSSCGSGMVSSEKDKESISQFCDGYIKEAMESLVFHE